MVNEAVENCVAFYAVYKGKQPGVYTSWDKCLEQVKSYSGPVYKKFDTLEEAHEFAVCGKHTAKTSKRCDPYAVRRGRQPGIYTTWADCQAQTDGFVGAQYRKFSTLEEAQLFMSGKSENSCKAAKTGGGSENSCKAVKAGGGTSNRARSALAAVKERTPNEIQIYTDGACVGSVGSAGKQGRAGWGMVVILLGGPESNEKPLDFYGPVLYCKEDFLSPGATCGTNNTGELSAVGMALKWLDEMDNSGRPCRILYDSKYAAYIAQGIWNAKENQELARNVQQCRKKATASRKVEFEHVKGHAGHPNNERADRNANLGAAGQTQMWKRASVPLMASVGKMQNMQHFQASLSAGAKRNEKPHVDTETSFPRAPKRSKPSLETTCEKRTTDTGSDNSKDVRIAFDLFARFERERVLI